MGAVQPMRGRRDEQTMCPSNEAEEPVMDPEADRAGGVDYSLPLAPPLLRLAFSALEGLIFAALLPGRRVGC